MVDHWVFQGNPERQESPPLQTFLGGQVIWVHLDMTVKQVFQVHLVLLGHQVWDSKGEILVTQAFLVSQDHKAYAGTLDLLESQESQALQD